MPHAPIELLTMFERPIRAPLPKAIAYIHGGLDHLPDPKCDPTAYCRGLAQCFNQGALVQLAFGLPDSAQALCTVELRLIDFLADRTGLRELRLYGLQPWINLARLDRIQGQTEQAAWRLRLLLHALDGQAVKLGELSINALDWQSIRVVMPNLSLFVRDVWVCETLLFGLRTGRLEAIDHADELVRRWPFGDTHLAIREARMMSRTRDALARLDADWPPGMPWTLSELKKDSLAFRNLESQVKDGTAGQQVFDDVAALALYHLSKERNSWRLALIQHCVALLLPKHEQRTFVIAESAYNVSQQIEDDVFSFWFAEACFEETAGAAQWAANRTQIAEESWYAVLREAVSPDDQRAAEVRRLFDRLMSITVEA